MRRVAIASFVCLLIAFGTLAVRAANPDATPDPSIHFCPGPGQIFSTNGSDYIVYFNAVAPATASFDVRLYAADHEYTATIPALTLSMPFTRADHRELVRSHAIDLRKPAGSEIVGATVLSKPSTGEPCSPQNLFVPSVANALMARAAGEHQADIDKAIAAEAAIPANLVTLTTVPPTAFTCAKPFGDAHVTKTVSPDYPAAANGALGRTLVAVHLDDAGAVRSSGIYQSSGNSALDDAAADAAGRSTYASATFACKPVAAAYIFNVVFDHTGQAPTEATPAPAPTPTRKPAN